jgi:hypothetical protein
MSVDVRSARGGRKSYSFTPLTEVAPEPATKESEGERSEVESLEKRSSPAEIEPGMDLEEFGIIFHKDSDESEEGA